MSWQQSLMKNPILAIPFLSLAASCVLTTTSCGPIVRSVRNEIRQNEVHRVPPRLKLPPVEDVSVSSEPLNWKEGEFAGFTELVRGLLRARDFEGLDSLAAKLRKNEERFRVGGGWLIHSFYLITGSPESGSEDAWRSHIRILEDWKAAKPRSIAARVSLAEANIGHAWNIRGTGYINEVPPEVMPVFEARMQRAAAEFSEASQLDEKCYGYFEGLLSFARGGGVERTELDRVFADAMAYDPTYQYFYVEKAQYLMPRWAGQPGELEAFVDSIVTSRGEEEGLKLYYLVLAALHGYRYEGDGLFNWKDFSWKRTKKGFVQFEKDHGMSRARLNEFTKMAESAFDAQAQCNSFKRLQGEADFEPDEWKDRGAFERQKKLVLEYICTVPRFNNQAE
jgi:hypothetical protein